MKMKILVFLFLLSSATVIAGCDHKKQYRPEARIVNALNTRFPKASKVEWEQKKGYYVAEFYDNGTKNEAWFDHQGKWMMTESDIKYTNLPQAIRNQFEKSMYNGWKKEDVNKIERAGMKPVYIVEVEKEGQDSYLYFSENGQLVKTIHDRKKGDPMDYMPVPAAIRTIIAQKYPDANIIETELDKGKYEIDILDNGRSKEVMFNDNTWLSTSWKVSKAEVPTSVMEAYRRSDYGKYAIDDIHFIETPERSFYQFDLEQGDKDAYLSINPQGEIVNK